MMASVADIRLSVDFFAHPKTVKLERRLDLEGLKALLVLWTWSARNRPDGDLSALSDEDIEIAAGWSGQGGDFISVCADLHWLDGEAGARVLHEWSIHNPWAAAAEERSNAARFSRMGATHPELYRELYEQGTRSITREEYDELLTVVNGPLAPSPSPSPSPESKNRLDLSTDLSTEISTEISTVAAHDDLVRLLYKLAPDCPAHWEEDARFINRVAEEYPTLNIESELQRALKWVQEKRFTVMDPKGYFYGWLKKSRGHVKCR